MIQQSAHVDKFKKQLRDSLKHQTLNSRAVKIAKHKNVYSWGDTDEHVYFIERGQVKLVILSPQ